MAAAVASPSGPRTVLLQMPWATTLRPSIALGILSRLCQRESIPVQTFYPNLDLSATLGPGSYEEFADARELFGLSEHLFAADMFGPAALHSDEFLERVSQALVAGERLAHHADVRGLLRLRDEILPAFLGQVAERVLAEEPALVGFTTTFNQVMSSLALARRIKLASPRVQVVLGGACVDGEMGREYHRALPDVIDHVFLGEAEESFSEYLRRLRDGRPTAGIPGLTTWAEGQVQVRPGPPLADLEKSPPPDYDGYFAEIARVNAEDGNRFRVESLPFESSRGCWWGQKNHCVFCGINDEVLTFRAKPVDRVVQEIQELASRHQVLDFTATDWIISRWHCDELFRRLKDLNLDLRLFYEIRPSLTKAQVKAMFEAGIVHIQPGIESFSTPLLRLMRKHSTGIRQVQFLRWCREAGIRASYNILSGFPGETAEWYRDMTALVPRLVHLQPPAEDVCRIEMHRFAPLHERRLDFDVASYDLRADYRFNFPVGMVDERKVGYFFDHESRAVVAEDEYLPELSEAVRAWISAHRGSPAPTYEYKLGPDFVDILDRRGRDHRHLRLSGLHRAIVLLCDEVRGRRTLVDELARLPLEAGAGVDDAIAELEAVGVVMCEGEYVLTLPIGQRFRTTEELRRHALDAAVAGVGLT